MACLAADSFPPLGGKKNKKKKTLTLQRKTINIEKGVYTKSAISIHTYTRYTGQNQWGRN